MPGNEEFTVTPFDVEGHVDYNKLLDKFGTDRITEHLLQRIEEHTGEVHRFLRRGFYYSHRDLDKVLDDYENGDDFFLYTGIGPSSKHLHIGHISQFYLTKWLQDKFDVNVYIQITDDEKYWSRDLSTEEIEENIQHNVKDLAAVGFDPDKTFIFRNREYMGNMYEAVVNVAERIRNSMVQATFGFDGATNIGMNFFPAIQTVPTFFEDKRCLIPNAIDQDPYWRIQRDIAGQLGYDKTAAVHSKFIPALTGPDGKMSSSKPKTTVFLNESHDAVRDKVMKHAHSGGQKSKEEHREQGADLSVDIAYQWLYNLFEPSDERIAEIGRKYENGALLTGEVKQILVERLWEFLQAHQERKQAADQKVKEYMYDGALAQEMWERSITL